MEAALTFAFVAVGVPQGVALSATLLHRVVFYWLRIPLGAAAMKWLSYPLRGNRCENPYKTRVFAETCASIIDDNMD